MTRFNWMLAIPGLLLALGAGVTVYLGMTTARSAAEPTGQQVARVVIATGNVSDGTVLEQVTLNRLFRVDLRPVDGLPPDFLSSLGGLEGRVLSTTLTAGQPLLASHLLQAPTSGSGPSVTAGLPSGSVAVVLPVNEQLSLGGALRPADRVDLIASLPIKQADGAQRVVTQSLLRDVRVLATGSITARPAPGETAPRGSYSTITLAVAPADALLVQHLLATNVRLALVLRRPEDATPAESPPPITNEDIVRRFGLDAAR